MKHVALRYAMLRASSVINMFKLGVDGPLEKYRALLLHINTIAETHGAPQKNYIMLIRDSLIL